MCWVDREGGGFWAVTTHPEVSSIGADPVGFCSSRGILIDEIGTTYDTPPTMMHTDPPQHTRYRRLVQPGFKPSMVRLMEAGVTAKARALIDPIEAGVAIDVVPALSVPLPLQVICELLGVDGAQWPRFFEWSEAVIPGASDHTEERARPPADGDVGVPHRGGGRNGGRHRRTTWSRCWPTWAPMGAPTGAPMGAPTWAPMGAPMGGPVGATS